MGVTSLVWGILGLVLSFVPCLGIYGMVFTVPGIIFGGIAIAKASKANSGKGISIAGFVVSLVGTGIALYWCLFMGAVASTSNELSKSLNELSGAAKSASGEMSKSLDELKSAAKEASDKLDSAANELMSSALSL